MPSVSNKVNTMCVCGYQTMLNCCGDVSVFDKTPDDINDISEIQNTFSFLAYNYENNRPVLKRIIEVIKKDFPTGFLYFSVVKEKQFDNMMITLPEEIYIIDINSDVRQMQHPFCQTIIKYDWGYRNPFKLCIKDPTTDTYYPVFVYFYYNKQPADFI